MSSQLPNRIYEDIRIVDDETLETLCASYDQSRERRMAAIQEALIRLAKVRRMIACREDSIVRAQRDIAFGRARISILEQMIPK